MDLARLLAESLRRLRQETGLNQKDLAKRLGVSHPTLHRLETGDHYTTLRVIEQLCRGLRCKPGDLFEPGRLRLPPRRSR